ncbi:MAG: thioredoxin family protein [Candidatus Kapabacteria bacterium]|nr:thioredoxin family protein [Candidatus Kapabacteria bacterium]
MNRKILLLVLLCCFSFTTFSKTYQIQFKANSSNLNPKKGDEFVIQLKFKLDKFWHTYPLKEQIGPDGIGPKQTEIKVKPSDKIVLNGNIQTSKTLRSFDSTFNMFVESFEGSGFYLIPVKAKKDLNFTKDSILVEVYTQFCDTMRCIDNEFNIPISKELFKVDDAKDIDTSTAKVQVAQVDNNPHNNSKVQGQATPSNSKNVNKTDSQKEFDKAIEKGIGSFIWLAIGAGALSLLTPCVFPMVPITVSFFTKRAEKAHKKGLRDSLIFATGIISTFTVIGLVFTSITGSAGGLSDLAANAWFNLVLAIIIVILALNLFGAFEIQLPTSILNKLNAKSQGNGLTAIFLMGLTFSLTSFTCTVPFVSLALGSAATGKWFYPIIGMLAYSTVFAAPFFLLSLFPKVLKSLPKSGGWMNNIKVVFGFLELAFAIKFFSNVDLAWDLNILPREVFLSFWIACFLLATLYILGFYKMKLDSETDRVGGVRAMFAIAFATITIYLIFGLSGKTFFNDLNSYLPPYTFAAKEASMISAGVIEKEEEWIMDYKTGIEKAKKEGKNVFVDFTGYTCVNCRWMEQNIFPDQTVKELMSKYVLIRLYTDRRQEPELTNKKMQENKYGSIELPLYVILKPNEEYIGSQAFDRDKNKFIKFLKNGLSK